MNLEKTWRIVLTKYEGKKKLDLIQYLEAETLDLALSEAKNNFDARLWRMEKPVYSSGQKACKLTMVHEDLKFGFRGGWVTIYGKGEKSIYEMMEEAENHPFKDKDRGEITDVSGVYCNGKKVF